jgi:hypothetical protein
MGSKVEVILLPITYRVYEQYPCAELKIKK